MAHDDNWYETFYRKLLSLYPRAFREQFGASMEQTFTDLCRERRKAGEGLAGFALWTYTDTFIGVIKEEIYNNMKSKAFKILLATNAVASAILFVTWWINGRDDTWLYVTSEIIVLSSFFYMVPPKKR